MTRKILIIISLMGFLLAGCNSNGPSNGDAKEIIYGVYLQEARILQKKQCDLTSGMEEEGHRNVWFIRYKFTQSGNEGGMIISESDSAEYPWQVFHPMADRCPEN